MKNILRLLCLFATLAIVTACENTPTPVDNVTPAGTSHGKSGKHDNSMADAPTAPGTR